MKQIFNSVLRYIKQTDRILVFVTMLAAAYGFILVFSATQGSVRIVLVQTAGFIVGMIAMIVISKIDYHSIVKSWRFIAIGCFFMFILTLVLGKSRVGSSDKSWIWLGPVTIQPAEFVKVAFVITFAMHCDKVKANISSPLNIALLTLHALIPICFLLLQKDMGMTLVFFMIFIIMLYMANVKLRYFAIAGIAIFSVSPLLWNKVLGATQKNRILALFDPKKYVQDAYQQTQGRTAIGSGKLFGYGLFHGPFTQGSAFLLPEKQNDMIFAVAGEELGFIGCMLIFIIFSMLLVKIISDARNSKDDLGSLLCIGIFSTFAVQILINIGAALMLFPITGISLPFFSSGGSSIVSSFLAIGLVLSVYMHRQDAIFTSKKS